MTPALTGGGANLQQFPRGASDSSTSNNSFPALTSELYRTLNEAHSREFHWHVGRGVGLGADLLGVMKGMLRCLVHGYRFVLEIERQPKGWLTGGGWSQYFAPHFEIRNSIRGDLFNRPHFPLDSRLHEFWASVTRVALIGHAPRGSRWMFDPWPPFADPVLIAGIGSPMSYLQACRWLFDIIWDLQPHVRRRVAETRGVLDLPPRFVAVHIRRGDKRLESPYVPADRFARIIRDLNKAPLPIVVATDDVAVLPELQTALGRDWQVVTISVGERPYDQSEFNRLPTEYRFEAILRFITEVEILRRAEHFIGSWTTNVACLVRYLRSAVGTTLVEP